METKKLYIYNGIENQLEEISGLKEAKEYIKDYIEDGDIHPDIESIIILEEVGGVNIDETGEQTKLNGDVVPVCKVDVFLNNDNKEIEILKNALKEIDASRNYEDALSIARKALYINTAK